MASALEKSEQHDLHIVADGQRGRRGVETDIATRDAAFQVFFYAGRDVVDEPAPLEFGDKVHCVDKGF